MFKISDEVFLINVIHYLCQEILNFKTMHVYEKKKSGHQNVNSNKHN